MRFLLVIVALCELPDEDLRKGLRAHHLTWLGRCPPPSHPRLSSFAVTPPDPPLSCRRTNQTARGGSTLHIRSGMRPTSRSGIVGMSALYCQRCHTWVARISTRTVAASPNPVKPATWATVG